MIGLVKDFLKREDIQEALENENLDLVYRRFEPMERSNLTRFFLELGIDPMEYLTKRIPDYCYEDALSIGEHEIPHLKIPTKFSKVGYYAFAGSDSIKVVEFEDGVEEIMDYCFAGSNNITDVYIPDSVSYIGDYIFGTANHNVTVHCNKGSGAERVFSNKELQGYVKLDVK